MGNSVVSCDNQGNIVEWKNNIIMWKDNIYIDKDIYWYNWYTYKL